MTRKPSLLVIFLTVFIDLIGFGIVLPLLPLYAEHYDAKGWQIGSGPVESACKTVVGNRLKGGGMRWGSPGADAVCHLRAVYLSQPDCWDALWRATCA